MTRAQEGWRRAAVRSCEVFFLLVLLEGIFRKWLLNPIEQPLLFIRDPLLAMLYLQYLGQRRWRPPLWSLAIFFLVALFLIFILVQALYLDLPPAVYLIGMRNYIGYIPLAFVMPEIFNRSDLHRLLRLCLFATIPVAILVGLQFLSAPTSPLNKGLGETGEGVFLVADDMVRPYGPFTFTYGQALFSALTVCACLIALERRKEAAIPAPLLAVCLIAVGVMGALSGSRTYFLTLGLILFCYAFSSISSRSKSLSATRLIYSAGGLLGMIVLLAAVFPTAGAALAERQADAVATEGSTLNRIVFVGTEALSVITNTPVFGYGIGFGSNAGAFLASGRVSFTLAEYEWTRIVLECGPLLGLIVIWGRILLTVIVGVAAWRVNSRTGDAAPLIMFGFVCPLIFYSPISNNNTLLSFAWFSLGWLLALMRTARRQPLRDTRRFTLSRRVEP